MGGLDPLFPMNNDVMHTAVKPFAVIVDLQAGT